MAHGSKEKKLSGQRKSDKTLNAAMLKNKSEVVIPVVEEDTAETQHRKITEPDKPGINLGVP